MGFFESLFGKAAPKKPNIQSLAMRGDVAGLVQALELFDDYDTVTQAIPALAAFPDSHDAVDVLLRMSQRGHEVYRKDAVGALGRMFADQASDNPDREKIAKSILKLLNDPEFGIRQEAIEVLGRCRIKAAVPRLIQSLSEDNDECTHAAKALSQIGDPSAIPAIEARLEHESSDYRQNCFRQALAVIKASQQ